MSRRFRTTAAVRPRSVASKAQGTQHGALYRSDMQARAARGHRSVFEERRQAAREQMQAAGTSWWHQGRASAASVRLRYAAAREAEAAPHVRRARASVPQLLS